MSKHATSTHYDGWFVNLFTKEGRAENKVDRADRLRERSKGKAADDKARLHERADENEIRASELTRGVVQKEALGPSNAASLWGVGFPWLRRPESPPLTSKATKVQDLAEGARPGHGLINVEQRATIIAGLTILRRAHNPREDKPGYGPFRAIDVDQVPVLLDDASQDKRLVQAVAKAARARGDKEPKSLNTTAEYIRDLVEAEHLGKPAWAMRAMLLYRLAPEVEDRATERTATAAGVIAGIAAFWIGLPPKTTKAVTEAGVRIGAKAAKRSEYKALSRFEQLYAQMLADALVSRRIKDELQDSQKEYADLEQDLALARRVAFIKNEIEDDLSAAEHSRSTRRNILIFSSAIVALGIAATAHHYKKVRVAAT
jgi:hypothetical protein